MDTIWQDSASICEAPENDVPEAEIRNELTSEKKDSVPDTEKSDMGQSATFPAEDTAASPRMQETPEEKAEEEVEPTSGCEPTDQKEPPTLEKEDGTKTEAEEAFTDFDALATRDLLTLKEAFPEETATLKSLFELPDPQLFGAFRESGLSAREAYRAMQVAVSRRETPDDNGKFHLRHSVIPRGTVASGSGISYREMQEARELFSDLSPSELISLYKRVKN